MGLDMVPIFRQLRRDDTHGYTLIEVTDNATGQVAGLALLVLPEYEVQAKAAAEFIESARRAAAERRNA